MSSPISDAKAKLLAAIARYTPGTAVTPDVDDAVKAAGADLEALAGVPNVVANPSLVDGQWRCLFDSRNLLHTVSRAMMTNGAAADAPVSALQTTQELRPAEKLYRNMVFLAAGPERLPVLYVSSGVLGFDPSMPNMFQISFVGQDFIAGDARMSGADVRAALGLPDDFALSSRFPARGPFPSEVSYVDEDLRINRGKLGNPYIAVLQRI
jgi:hypothetical protein